MKVEVAFRRPPEQARRVGSHDRATSGTTWTRWTRSSIRAHLRRWRWPINEHHQGRRARRSWSRARRPPTSPASAMLAEHHPLDLRHLDAGERHRQRDRQDRRQQLVLPDGGLRVRPRSSRRDTEAVVVKGGGKVLGKVRHPLNCVRISPRSCCRRRPPRRRSSAWRTPVATPPTRSSRPAEFGIVQAAGRTSPGMLVFLSDIHGLGLQTRRRA